MPEDVRVLLARGIAAVKSGQEEGKEEARHCLERVLRSVDAEADQKVDAWLWLSRVENDPLKKRQCLESVLALDPGNGSAHQGLAVLDRRLKAEEIIDPAEDVRPLKPAESPSGSSVRCSTCPKCGGQVSYDAGRGLLVCSFCGTPREEMRASGQESAVTEQDFFSALATAKGRRWELPVERTLTCGGCGARFALSPRHLSGSCPFCRSAHVVAAEAGDLIQPSALVPFQFDGEEAGHTIRAWISRQRFRPNDLDDAARFEVPHAAYLPFWTFDLGGTMNWRAMVAENRGRTSKWVPRTGLYLVYHDDLLVPAGHSLPQDRLDALLDFDTKALVPYSTDLLAGYTSEIYQVSLDEASVLARQRALQIGSDYEKKNSLGGQRYRDFVMSTAGLVVDAYKLVLLPVWLGCYRYKDQIYPVEINGQTGTVTGLVPRNGLQRALAALFGSQ